MSDFETFFAGLFRDENLKITSFQKWESCEQKKDSNKHQKEHSTSSQGNLREKVSKEEKEKSW